jgi:hypothetical protein
MLTSLFVRERPRVGWMGHRHVTIGRISRKLGHQTGIPLSGLVAAPFLLRRVHPNEVRH